MLRVEMSRDKVVEFLTPLLGDGILEVKTLIFKFEGIDGERVGFRVFDDHSVISILATARELPTVEGRPEWQL